MEKTLIIFPGALGDFICFLPTLGKLAGRGDLHLLARIEYGDLVPTAVRVGSLEREEIARLFVREAAHDEKLRRYFGSYSSIYSWMGSADQDVIDNLQALSRGILRIFPFHPSVPGMHRVDYYLSCLGRVVPEEAVPKTSQRREALSWAQTFWHRNGLAGEKVLALAPGSGAGEKNWPVEFYQAVTEWWVRQTGGRVIVVLGPVEEERDGINEDWGDAWVVRSLSLGSLAALLRRCDLYLGNDSGVTHLAAALGVETVALFGPTDVVQWAPRGKRVRVVTRNVECSPCSLPAMKRCSHRKCLTELKPADVTKYLEELVGLELQSCDDEIVSLTRG